VSRARDFVELAGEATVARGRFTVAFSGGSTPHAMYALLAGSPDRARVA
jgi:6-phosphogluconolactonase